MCFDYIIAKHKYRRSVKVNMFCPACKERLVLLGTAKLYETLAEHVSDPNQKIHPKPAFGCLNEKCELFYSSTGWYFGVDGNLYGLLLPKADLQYAIGSLSYHSDKSLKKLRRR